MEPLDKMDVGGALRDAGFVDVEIAPFAEAPDALSKDRSRWRLPWVVILGRKPDA
jgi:hypothetical protein